MNCDSTAVFLEVFLYIIFLCKSLGFFILIVFEVFEPTIDYWEHHWKLPLQQSQRQFASKCVVLWLF